MKKKQQGLSLLSVIILIALLLIAAIAILQFLHILKEQALKLETEKELKELYKAILGDGETHFGYHGDMGVLPYRLADLVVQGSQPSSHTGASSGQLMGWKGPYFKPKRWNGTDILDPYGNPYVSRITSSGGSYYWQLLSVGKDGTLGTSDDIFVRPPIEVRPVGIYYYIPSSAYVSISVGTHSGPENPFFRTFFPVYGNESYSDTSGSFIIENIPVGKRMVWAAIYLDADPRMGWHNCGYYHYPPYTTKIVSFPLKKPGNTFFQFHTFFDLLNADVRCRLIGWWFVRVDVRIKSSLTWDPPSCTASQNGVVLHLLNPTLILPSWYEIPFNSVAGYFYFTDWTLWWGFPIEYHIISNSGQKLTITINSLNECL